MNAYTPEQARQMEDYLIAATAKQRGKGKLPPKQRRFTETEREVLALRKWKNLLKKMPTAWSTTRQISDTIGETSETTFNILTRMLSREMIEGRRVKEGMKTVRYWRALPGDQA